jgi:hypothetical protein
MESITRLVSESLARHGFDRPVDYRRLHWSRWFRCESVRSLLFVPSQPGVFALAEEVMEFPNGGDGQGLCGEGKGSDGQGEGLCGEGKGSDGQGKGLCGDGRLARPAERSEATLSTPAAHPEPKRMLAVNQFFEDDDMAFVLDRMLSVNNPMRPRLISGRYFVRFVVIEDAQQRRSICGALNQWIANSGEKASGIGAHFATSLELTETNLSQNVARALSPATADGDNAHVASNAHVATAASAVPTKRSEAEPFPAVSSTMNSATPQPDSGAASNLHCPAPFPSGF